MVKPSPSPSKSATPSSSIIAKTPDPASRRAKARRWGVVYASAAGEPADDTTKPEEPNPPTP